MRFGSTAKVLAECKLKYYRISECTGLRVVERAEVAGSLTLQHHLPADSLESRGAICQSFVHSRSLDQQARITVQPAAAPHD